MKRYLFLLFFLPLFLPLNAEQKECVIMNVERVEEQSMCLFLHDIEYVIKQEQTWVVRTYSGEEYRYPVDATSMIFSMMEQPEFNEVLLDFYYNAPEQSLIFAEWTQDAVYIYTMSGQIVYQNNEFSGDRVFVGNLPLGGYVLQVGTKVAKFIKL